MKLDFPYLTISSNLDLIQLGRNIGFIQTLEIGSLSTRFRLAI